LIFEEKEMGINRRVSIFKRINSLWVCGVNALFLLIIRGIYWLKILLHYTLHCYEGVASERNITDLWVCAVSRDNTIFKLIAERSNPAFDVGPYVADVCFGPDAACTPVNGMI
jgi:hypothetical protein